MFQRKLSESGTPLSILGPEGATPSIYVDEWAVERVGYGDNSDLGNLVWPLFECSTQFALPFPDPIYVTFFRRLRPIHLLSPPQPNSERGTGGEVKRHYLSESGIT